ncbi:hypothetical protein HPULCUR_006416 [Helicostylum pulchrum]|uniref:Uncharacterized protein n=1 Tax=Helicostylum pulchrum TaxID=562976 RepID=A0ABP9Y1V9_9FUNG
MEGRINLIDRISPIGNFCTFLKTLRCSYVAYQDIWKIIKEERSKGNFRSLQYIPRLNSSAYESVLCYNNAACSLEQTLHELVIRDNSMALIEGKTSHFPKVHTIFLKFAYYVDAYVMNRYMERLPSATVVDISIKNYGGLNEDQDVTEFDIHVSPKVKKLTVKHPYCYNKFYIYIMKAFPNLQKVNINVRGFDTKKEPMPTEEAVQFLEYLLRVPKFSAFRIPVESQNDVFIGLLDNNRHIKTLDITYVMESLSGSDFVSMESLSDVKDGIVINIFRKGKTSLMLPHIGLVQESGKDLLYLHIDMGIETFGHKAKVLRRKRGIALSSILQRCPRLLGVSIYNTALDAFGIYLEFQESIEIRDYITILGSLIRSSFLSDLSDRVSFTSQFTLTNCQFFDEAANDWIREIDMPHTQFDEIRYEEEILSNKVCLKLIKTICNTVSWYVSKGAYLIACIEKQYEDSVKNKNIPSLFIRCKDVHAVIISLTEIHVVLNLK